MQPLPQKLADWRHRVRAAGAALPPALPAVCPPSTRTSNSSSSNSSNTSCHSRRQHPRQPAATSTTSAGAGPARAQAAAAPPAAAAEPLSVGDAVSVSCTRLGTGGVGVCLWGPSQFVLLVKGALPGEQLTAVVTAVKKSYSKGSKVSTQQPHSDAVPPACQHYGTCGGCSLQALAYPAQLPHKTDYVQQVLRRVGKVPEAEVAAAQQPAVAAEAVYGYRNKVQLAFSSLVWQQQQQQQQSDGQQTDGGAAAAGVQGGAVQQGFGLGYFLPGSNSVVLPIQECSLASPDINQVVSEVRQLCQQYGLQPHNTPDGCGVLRHLIVRSAAAAGAGAGAPTAAAAPATAEAHGAAAAAADTWTPDTTAAAADTATPDAAAGGVAGGGAGRKLLAVLVTNSSVSAEPAASKSRTETALAAVAQQLMQRCLSLSGVVHSIEAAATPAAAERGERGLRSNSGSKGRGRQQGGSVRRGGPSSRDGALSSDDSSSDGGSGRGAQPLRVSSSRVLAGTGHLVEHLCGLQFRVSPHSFFQTNTAQAERLYGEVVQAAAEALPAGSSSSGSGQRTSLEAGADNSSSGSSDGSGLVLDLYCGTGTIALCLAAALPGRQVVGCDVSASNIEDARANAELNGLANVSFVCGDLNLLRSAAAAVGSSKQGAQRGSSSRRKGSVQKLEGLKPQVVVVDPARAGLGASVIEYLLGCGARRVVYVSCNAATQARDLQQLCSAAAGFWLASWTAVDLFPQTDVAHVETVAVLDRTG